ncbi:DUF2163 domain-containing protein [Xanthobacter aminoxidans]|uniref:DUF2163 domain-containing protein n=1 Tax=Xanthobacter aminoxidans TaxID=186280 RepID=UPI002022F79D|nr:DUF2163 domain-containing protein [Xanthobacter aminoxidans]MCL8385575.1 DUF2163 domain-containing protein [Xanthobacter aminoxidans]
MRSFNATTLAKLDAGAIVTRGLLLFDFPSGLYGFWDGVGTLTYSGVDYVGAGRLISADAIGLVGDLSASSITLTLSAIPDAGLDPDVLATLEAEVYHQRPVTLSRAYIDPDTRALISVERVFRGYVDQVSHEYTIGGGSVLTCAVESRARDNTRKGWRTRSDADQKRIDASDGGMRHATIAGKQVIYWGKYPGTVKK